MTRSAVNIKVASAGNYYCKRNGVFLELYSREDIDPAAPGFSDTIDTKIKLYFIFSTRQISSDIGKYYLVQFVPTAAGFNVSMSDRFYDLYKSSKKASIVLRGQDSGGVTDKINKNTVLGRFILTSIYPVTKNNLLL